MDRWMDGWMDGWMTNLEESHDEGLEVHLLLPGHSHLLTVLQ